MDGRSAKLRGKLACHCLLLEQDDGLTLIDTGLGLNDVRDPKGRLSKFFLGMLKPDFREQLTAVRQVERLGFKASDVRDIVLTHLDFDHAGGLDDFPNAAVHLLASERQHAVAQKTWLDRQRFRPQQWSTAANWRVYQAGEGETWFGLDAVRSLDGVSDQVLMVPLLGHTYGHTGVAVNYDGRWLLLAGDAYFFHREMDIEKPRCTPGLRFYQWMMQKDGKARRWNQQRLRELKAAHGAEVRIICSHDPIEFEELSGRALDEPLDISHRIPISEAAERELIVQSNT